MRRAEEGRREEGSSGKEERGAMRIQNEDTTPEDGGGKQKEIVPTLTTLARNPKSHPNRALEAKLEAKWGQVGTQSHPTNKKKK